MCARRVSPTYRGLHRKIIALRSSIYLIWPFSSMLLAPWLPRLSNPELVLGVLSEFDEASLSFNLINSSSNITECKYITCAHVYQFDDWSGINVVRISIKHWIVNKVIKQMNEWALGLIQDDTNEASFSCEVNGFVSSQWNVYKLWVINWLVMVLNIYTLSSIHFCAYREFIAEFM